MPRLPRVSFLYPEKKEERKKEKPNIPKKKFEAVAPRENVASGRVERCEVPVTAVDVDRLDRHSIYDHLVALICQLPLLPTRDTCGRAVMMQATSPIFLCHGSQVQLENCIERIM
jgi:hypothetical protein